MRRTPFVAMVSLALILAFSSLSGLVAPAPASADTSPTATPTDTPTATPTNTPTATPTATPTPSIESVMAQVTAYQASGDIRNPGVARALTSALQAAQAAIDIGMPDTAAAHLGAFIHVVEAQTGKNITSSAAADLIASVQWILANI